MKIKELYDLTSLPKQTRIIITSICTTITTVWYINNITNTYTTTMLPNSRLHALTTFSTLEDSIGINDKYKKMNAKLAYDNYYLRLESLLSQPPHFC